VQWTGFPGAGGRASRPHPAAGKRRAGRDLKLVATEEGVRLRARRLILIAPRMEAVVIRSSAPLALAGGAGRGLTAPPAWLGCWTAWLAAVDARRHCARNSANERGRARAGARR
jgi:hypothetical protein